MNSAKIAEWIGKASGATLLALILVTGYFGVWVWGSTYKEMIAQRDELKVMVIQAYHLNGGAAQSPIRTSKDLDMELERIKQKIEINEEGL